MPEEFQTQVLRAARPPRTGRRILIAFVLLLLVGAGTVGWLVWRGSIDLADLPSQRRTGAEAKLAQPVPVHAPPAAAPQAPAAPPIANPPVTAQVGSVETRLALLEERLSRLDLRAEAASGNAARAEGLLIAFAARRSVDRGAPLGYLEDQLKLRFADAQPNAVRTIVEAAAAPVTLDALLAKLDSLGLAMIGSARNEDTWSRMKREFSGLFVIRRESNPSVRPEDRLQRAKLMLAAGKVNEAVDEVRHLPGAQGAQDWIASAQRYEEVQRALDLIETTALLDEHRLQDSAGNRVEQPSPLTEPAVIAAPAI